MAKRPVNYPHIITFRLTDEAWLKVEQEVAGTALNPHDWCRAAALEKLNRGDGLSKGERLLFEQFARSQYLVTQGFQLVAEDKLTPEQWKKYRNFATRNVQELAEGALKSIRAGKASGESDG